MLFFWGLLACWLGADVVVVIDPGHGGEMVRGKTDGSHEGIGSSWNNARAPFGAVLEKELCLEYSQEIVRALVAEPRAKQLKVRPALTRQKDRHLGAMLRAAYAVELGARVFISVHFNGSRSKTTQGTRAYYCSGDHPEWEYLHFVNPYAERDRTFAMTVVNRVARALQPFGGKPEMARVMGDCITDGGHLRDGIRTIGYARQDPHLHKAVVILLEVEFMDNPEVAAWLLGSETREPVRKAVAAAVAKAVCDHLETDRPPTAPVKAR